MSSESLGKPTDGIISRYLNRRISVRITKFIVKHDINISPTEVSLVSFSIAILSSIFYYNGYPIVGGVLIQLSSIIDGVDGELARVRGLTSVRGGFIDTMLDRFANLIMYISIFLLINPNGDLFTSLITILAVSGDMLVTYLHSVVKKDFNFHPAQIGSLPPIASRDVRIFIIFVSSLFTFIWGLNMLIYGLLTVAVISYMYTIVKTFEVLRHTQMR